MKTKIILDTDIGNDMDDSFCLAYLLANPDCELLGVTTVCGEPVQRAMMVSAVCKQAGKDVPIYPGIAEPLLGKQWQPNPPQFREIGRWEHDKTFPENAAIEFMRKTIRENPGEVTLLAIGPLTNIAVLFSIDGEIPGMLKELVLMCGRFGNGIANMPIAEWNALCDPHATAIVYKSGAKIRSIGLDVTMQLVMSKDEVHKKFTANILKPVMDFSKVWGDTIVFHDPLASAVIFDDKLCGFKKGNVEVELKSDRLMGCTYFDEDENGNNLVAMSVDRDKFFGHYLDVVNKLNQGKEMKK